MLNQDAGPLYGIVWPILISASLAPGSYFCCANAGDAASSNVLVTSAWATRILAFLAFNARCDSATMACRLLMLPAFPALSCAPRLRCAGPVSFGDIIAQSCEI